MKRLTRSPAVTYTWMAIAILIVIALFNRWEPFVSRGRQQLWWFLLILFLIADYLFLIIPIKDSKSIRHLSRAGKLWAALAWVLVGGFVFVAVQGSLLRQLSWTTIEVASLGLLLLGALVYAIFRLSREWIRQLLRSIAARPGGGFRIHFVPNAEIVTALKAVPGAQPLETADEWVVPADPAAAIALLQLAKKYDFEFVPSVNSLTERKTGNGLPRGPKPSL